MTQNHNYTQAHNYTPSIQEIIDAQIATAQEAVADYNALNGQNNEPGEFVPPFPISSSPSVKRKTRRPKNKHPLSQLLQDYAQELRKSTGENLPYSAYLSGILEMSKYIDLHKPKKSEELEYVRGLLTACKLILENFKEEVAEVPETQIPTVNSDDFDDF